MMPRIPPLTSSTVSGKPYERHRDIEARIADVLQQSRGQWADLAGQLPDEVIVFVIRQVADTEPNLLGSLFSELSKRITRISRRWARGFSRITTEDILIAVELQLIELVLAETPSRGSDYLEVAFADAVKGRTIKEIARYKSRPTSLATTPARDVETQELADERAGIEDVLIQLENDARRPELIRRACTAVKDQRHLEAVILRYVDGWPLTDKDPNKPSLAKHFGMSGRQIQNWISDALKTMRAEIEDTI